GNMLAWMHNFSAIDSAASADPFPLFHGFGPTAAIAPSQPQRVPRVEADRGAAHESPPGEASLPYARFHYFLHRGNEPWLSRTRGLTRSTRPPRRPASAPGQDCQAHKCMAGAR